MEEQIWTAVIGVAEIWRFEEVEEVASVGVFGRCGRTEPGGKTDKMYGLTNAVESIEKFR